MYAKSIPIFAVESFVLFPFTGDYLNLLKCSRYFICSDPIKQNVYFCMIFSFIFFFVKRSMQIPIEIPTGSIQEIAYFTFSYIHGSWLFILWFHCWFCNIKWTFRVFTGFGHLQMSETSGRNMTVKWDSGIRSFQKLDGENEDLTLILRTKMDFFADTSAFNVGVKEKNTKTKQNYNC